MAYNTPSPQRAARATTAALANKAGVSGEIIFDTDKNTLVGMDGATNGGHPMYCLCRNGNVGRQVGLRAAVDSKPYRTR